ncbi:cytochrome P450 [Streptomyces sp. NPDC002644]
MTSGAENTGAPTPESDGSRFSLSNAEMFPDPYPYYARLRRDEPVHASHMYGGSWVFFAYEDVEALLTDPRLTNNRAQLPLKALVPEHRSEFSDMVPTLERWVAFFDGQAHMKRRRHMNHVFRMFHADFLTPVVEETVDALLDAWGQQADLVADFARPLPAIVITRLLGAPPGDHEQIAAWSDDIAFMFGSSTLTTDDVRRGRDAVHCFTRYLGTALLRASDLRVDSLLTRLVTEETDGFRFDDESAVAQGMLLMFAGLEPTRYLIGNAVWSLHRHPGQRRRLLADPELLPTAVEEFLRHDTPVQFVGRTAARSFTYKGRHIEEGQVVLLHVASANRDPGQFDDPDALDLGRAPNRHLSFGHGPHACIGALLVRLQTTIALRTLYGRFPGLRVCEEPGPVWNGNLGFHGPTSLLVRTTVEETR